MAEPQGGRPEKKVKVVLKRDYWPAEDEKYVAGQSVELSSNEAKRLVGIGVAEVGFPED